MKKGISWYAHRIMRMDAREIRWRVASLVREVVEVGRIVSHTEPKVTGPLPAPAFTTTLLTADEHRALLSAGDQDRLRDCADQLLDNQLTFFGRTVDMGRNIDWHRDWHQALTPKLRLSLFTDYRDAPRNGDCKEVWEPNRHHQLVVLARAYHALGDQRYADKVAQLLEHWLDQNPYGYGMNWRSPLELGIRLINWVWALDLIQDSGAVSTDLSTRLHQAAFLQCRDLAAKFSQGSSANNHLIGEAAGLFIAASYWFGQTQSAWIATSRSILEEQLVAQQFESGCTQEQALNYQFFVAQFYLFCGCVDLWTTRSLSDTYWRKLRQYLTFTNHFRGFDQQLPLFGDQDDGYVLNLGYHPHDLSDYRGWIAMLAGAPHARHSASALLLGKREPANLTFGTSECNGTPLPTATALFDAGYAFLNAPAQGISVLLDAGPLGYGSMAAHGHADALHFACSIDGQPLFVDSGTYDYFTYPELRSYFRSTRAHNTISLDGTDQSSMSGPFMWNRAAVAHLDAPAHGDAPNDDNGIQTIAGTITSYPAVDHKFGGIHRALALDASRGALSIQDRVDVTADTLVEHFFHVHPDVKVEPVDEHSYQFKVAGKTLMFTLPEGLDHRLETTGELSYFSPVYHQLRSGTCIATKTRANGASAFEFSLAHTEILNGAKS